MGVITVAWMPTSVEMRDSLELCVLLKILLNIKKTAAAMRSPQKAESGALIHGLRVASILVKINPKPPNAVMKDASVVGLNGAMPGMPVCSKPASAWP